MCFIERVYKINNQNLQQNILLILILRSIASKCECYYVEILVCT